MTKRSIFFSVLLTRMRQLCLTLYADSRGSTAVEFSLLLPVLAYLGIGVIDFGTGTYRQMLVQQAAQIGAEYAIIHGFDATAVSQAVVNGTSFSGVAANPAPTSYYGCLSGGAILISQLGGICADGSTPGTYVTVYASGLYATALNYPSIPSTFSLSGIATVRLK